MNTVRFALPTTKQTCVLTLTLLLAAALAGCASFEKCTKAACAGDPKITTDVSALLDAHAELGPPGAIRVQTIDGVVYLNGLVNTDLESENAEAIAYQAPNVKNVVNSIGIRGNSR
jgi:osmotically-inducible protein OsmY